MRRRIDLHNLFATLAIGAALYFTYLLVVEDDPLEQFIQNRMQNRGVAGAAN